MLAIVQLIILIASIAISAAIINGIQRAFMNLIGANVMFFNGKAKLIWIVLVGFIIFELVGKLFGWS